MKWNWSPVIDWRPVQSLSQFPLCVSFGSVRLCTEKKNTGWKMTPRKFFCQCSRSHFSKKKKKKCWWKKGNKGCDFYLLDQVWIYRNNLNSKRETRFYYCFNTHQEMKEYPFAVMCSAFKVNYIEQEESKVHVFYSNIKWHHQNIWQHNEPK